MYVISKTKDYYDGVVGTMGIDKTLVYNRETVINENRLLFPKPFTVIKNWNYDKNPFRNFASGYTIKKNSKFNGASLFIIGFCGKLYIGCKFYKEIKNDLFTKLEITITYDIEFIKKQLNNGWFNNLSDDIEYITKYNSIEIFRMVNSPIFIYDSNYGNVFNHTFHRRNEAFIINPILKNYEFYKIHNSFSAFQEIQMFLGGVLGRGEKEIIEIEDKYKIIQHGFNEKSFRKEKSNEKKQSQSKH